MKLRNILEAEVTPAVFQKHLVLFVDGAMGAVYIITDIPPISDEKFQKLYDLSFEPGSLAEWIDVIRIDHTDQRRLQDEFGNEFGTEDEPFANVTTYVYTWKAFVATMKEHYPFDEDDDFDE